MATLRTVFRKGIRAGHFRPSSRLWKVASWQTASKKVGSMSLATCQTAGSHIQPTCGLCRHSAALCNATGWRSRRTFNARCRVRPSMPLFCRIQWQFRHAPTQCSLVEFWNPPVSTPTTSTRLMGPSTSRPTLHSWKWCLRRTNRHWWQLAKNCGYCVTMVTCIYQISVACWPRCASATSWQLRGMGAEFAVHVPWLS